MDVNSKCVSFIENDKSACNIYRRNFPNATEYNDITDIVPFQIPEFDILLAGFPCQPFSQNSAYGTFVDMDDPRVGLFLHLVNICKVKQPKYFLLENVPRFTTMRNLQGIPMIELLKRKFQRIGYEVGWKTMNAAEFGVPQQRIRLYIMGTNTGDELKFPESPKQYRSVRSILDLSDSNHITAKNTLGKRKMRNEPHSRHQAMKLNYEIDAIIETDKPKKLSSVTNDTPSGVARQAEKLFSIDTVAPTVTTFANAFFDVDGVWRKLTVKETQRLFGFPDQFKLPKDYSQAIRLLGNSVCVPVVEKILRNFNFSRKNVKP